jgi:hypothetical protein
MNVYTSNLKPTEAITLKHAHQQLAGILANGRISLALIDRASRIQAEGQQQDSIKPSAYETMAVERYCSAATASRAMASHSTFESLPANALACGNNS